MISPCSTRSIGSAPSSHRPPRWNLIREGAGPALFILLSVIPNEPEENVRQHHCFHVSALLSARFRLTKSTADSPSSFFVFLALPELILSELIIMNHYLWMRGNLMLPPRVVWS